MAPLHPNNGPSRFKVEKRTPVVSISPELAFAAAQSHLSLCTAGWLLRLFVGWQGA
jgi:hypothetical protein